LERHRSFCIAQRQEAHRKRGRIGAYVLAAAASLAGIGAAAAQAGRDAGAAVAGAGSVAIGGLPGWINVPRVAGRLHASDIGLVVNSADPVSVQLGRYYAAARHLAPRQVLRVRLAVKPALDRSEFEKLQRAIAKRFGRSVQALALAWTAPYAVECNSITGALALGFDADLCRRTCARSRVSPYFNSASLRPLDDFGWRPSMLLAARDLAQAEALIDRGVASDGSLARRDHAPVSAMLLTTDDPARRVRSLLYPPPGILRPADVEVRIVPAADLAAARRVILAMTGSARVALEPPPDWVAGGLGDHLTSAGGDLLGPHHQTTALDWIASGATASHGTVSEPCNHLQKFPHPQVLLANYVQGSTAIEAYWKSVAWPQQSLFVGEPLAAPFASR
jgi:uncharacterized protein (TIGR03790 family)